MGPFFIVLMFSPPCRLPPFSSPTDGSLCPHSRQRDARWARDVSGEI